MLEDGRSTVTVTREAHDAYNVRLDAEQSGMAFVHDTGSVERNYYVNAEGRLQANTPFETAELWQMFEHPDFSDLELE